MGGTAFGFTCRRMERREHQEMVEEACGKIQGLGLEPRPVQCYRGKLDYGDIDILATGALGRRDELAGVFGSKKTLLNGDCLSLIWREAQLDIISVEAGLMDAAVGYFSWPDLGNFLGRIAKAAGFRYGHRGLARRVVFGRSKRPGTVDVSTCTRDIFGFFGLDYARWERGFDEREDIYSFVVSSPFFAKSLFEPKSLNHRERVRNRKRPVYAGLLGWAEGENLQSFDFEACSDAWWDQRAKSHFGGGWIEERCHLMRKEEQEEANSAKLNGDSVREITGLDGLDLGVFMRSFKASLDENLYDWLTPLSKESVDRAVLGFWKDFYDPE